MGYVNLKTKERITGEDAFLYALEKVQTDKDKMKWFVEHAIELIKNDEKEKEIFIECFYSGNYLEWDEEEENNV